MTDTRYIVSVEIDYYTETNFDQTPNEAAEFLLSWYASPDYSPTHTALYLYLDDGSIDLYDDFSYKKYSDKELNVVDHINTYASTQLIYKFSNQDETVEKTTVYPGIERQVEYLHAYKDTPSLEYIRIRYRLEPEWKTVT